MRSTQRKPWKVGTVPHGEKGVSCSQCGRWINCRILQRYSIPFPTRKIKNNVKLYGKNGKHIKEWLKCDMHYTGEGGDFEPLMKATGRGCLCLCQERCVPRSTAQSRAGHQGKKVPSQPLAPIRMEPRLQTHTGCFLLSLWEPTSRQ